MKKVWISAKLSRGVLKALKSEAERKGCSPNALFAELLRESIIARRGF